MRVGCAACLLFCLASSLSGLAAAAALFTMAEMNFVTFNQDHSILGVGALPCPPASSADQPGTSKGFRLYSTDPFSKCFESQEGDVAILEMLFSTSLVALILSPRVLRIQNTKAGRHGSARPAFADDSRDTRRYASLRSPHAFSQCG